MSPVEQDEQEILRLSRLLFDAVLRADRAPLEQYIADEFLLTYARCAADAAGKFVNKAQIITRWTTKDDDGTSAQTDIDQQRVLVSGDTAVLFGHIVDRWQESDGEHQAETWVSDTWVRRADGWRWLASHETFLVE